VITADAEDPTVEPAVDSQQEPRSDLDTAAVMPAGRMAGFMQFGLPWAAAVIGWTVAAVFILYSHGQSDRVGSTLRDTRSALAQMSQALDSARTAQDYASITGARIVQLTSLRSTGARATVNVLTAPGSLQGMVAARALPLLKAGQLYAVWARRDGAGFDLLATFTPVRPDGTAVTALRGAQALDKYRSVFVDIESNPSVRSPSSETLWSGSVGQHGTCTATTGCK
jgi:hypothetical protein